jgi:outer membrane protein OmpA-like peptidoglycan-associated protein
MTNGQPEMIPMPGPGQQGPPPGELSRQLSPQEERDVLINFMGNMYGEAKKMDNNIIGPTSTLQRGRSEEIKKQIEQVYTQPQQSAPVQAAPAPQPEIQQPQVQAQQSIQPLPQVDNNQLSFNFDTNEKDELFSLIEKILTRLDKLHRKVDELTLVHSDFIQTYQQAQEIVLKKKSPTKKRISKKEEV